MDQVEQFVLQAQACAQLGSPLYAALLTRAARDLAAGGVTADIITGYEEAPLGAAVSLRLLGAVHRLVLAGAAPALAAHYPSVGGVYRPHDNATDDSVWAAFQEVVRRAPDRVRETLTRPPQTNETGRSLPLIGALAVVSARSGGLPVRLIEIGASAGLNLRAEALRGIHRPADLAALPVGAPYAVTERIGCDLDPLDPTTEEGRLTLTSYVWPDDAVRLGRLRAALAVAARVPAEVRRAGAADLLGDLDLVDGTTTVLWHSVMWQYLPAAEQAAVLVERDRLAAGATPRRGFAQVSFEPPAGHDSVGFEVRIRWPGDGALSDELLGVAPPHGIPVTWQVGEVGAGP